jgi:hypothetical protein
MIITPIPSPTVTIYKVGALCPNSTVTLTANGGNTYVWNTTATTASIAASTVGVYTVTATATNSCTASSTKAVAAGTQSVVITGSPIITPTQAATVTAQASILPSTYLWSNNLTTASIAITEHGTYTVTATSSGGCTATASIRAEFASCAAQTGYTNIGNTGDSTLLSSLVGVNLPINPNWCTYNLGTVISCSVPDNGVPSTSPLLKWLIRGKLIIDIDTQMPNIDFRMCTDAGVQVGKYEGEDPFTGGVAVQGRTLSIFRGAAVNPNPGIQGIDKMWNGITVLNKSSVYIGFGNSNANLNFIIKDAIVGVKAHYGANISITYK